MDCISHASKIYLLFIYVGRTAFLIPTGGSPSLIPSSLNIFSSIFWNSIFSSIPDYLLLIHLGGLLFLIHHEPRFLIHLEFFFSSILELPCLHPFWITLVSCIQDCPVSSIHPSIHPDDLFKIHPWGGGTCRSAVDDCVLEIERTYVVTWWPMGHEVWKWIFCSQVVFVRGWKSGYNLVEIRWL